MSDFPSPLGLWQNRRTALVRRVEYLEEAPYRSLDAGNYPLEVRPYGNEGSRGARRALRTGEKRDLHDVRLRNASPGGPGRKARAGCERGRRHASTLSSNSREGGHASS